MQPVAPLAAVTGATGFLGRHLVAALVRAGFRVRLLVRQDPTHPLLAGIHPELVMGDLDSDAALSRLVRGADVVIHAAGLIKARDRAHFFAVNEGGSARLGQAIAAGAPGARLVIVSSQAAREPHLSDYAASKRAGEGAALAAAGIQDWVIIRPPAIYGPWDRETLALFKAMKGPLVPVLGGADARIAMIHATDAADAVAALARPGGPQGDIFTLADGVPGYGWGMILDTAALAMGRSPRRVALPQAALRLLGQAGSLRAALTGKAQMLTVGKVREISHPDWSVPPCDMPPSAIWQPRIALAAGFADTVSWYRAHGWL